MVITSSIVAIIAAKWFFEEEVPEGVVFNHDSRTPFVVGPYPSDFHAYNASKVAALEATNSFILGNKPSFKVININPSFVVGKNELITDVKDIMLGTNSTTLGALLGNKLSFPVFGASVHVDDGKSL